jgi:hypothetical protein
VTDDVLVGEDLVAEQALVDLADAQEEGDGGQAGNRSHQQLSGALCAGPRESRRSGCYGAGAQSLRLGCQGRAKDRRSGADSGALEAERDVVSADDAQTPRQRRAVTGDPEHQRPARRKRREVKRRGQVA